VGQLIGVPCGMPRDGDRQMVARWSDGWAGMVVFAGTILLVTGSINFFEGLIVLFNDERVVVLPDRFVLVDLTSWGWTLLLFGVAMFAVGAGPARDADLGPNRGDHRRYPCRMADRLARGVPDLIAADARPRHLRDLRAHSAVVERTSGPDIADRRAAAERFAPVTRLPVEAGHPVV
jgi:hypothetical protein